MVHRSRLPLGTIAVGAAGLLLAGPIHAQASAIAALSGSWSGGGQIRLSDGKSERVECRAYYNPKDGGSGLGVAIRCASTSYKIEMRSSLQFTGSQITGSWEERTFNAVGSVSGRSTPGALNLSISGAITGSMSITYSGSRQTVAITTQGSGLGGVSLSLSKG